LGSSLDFQKTSAISRVVIVIIVIVVIIIAGGAAAALSLSSSHTTTSTSSSSSIASSVTTSSPLSTSSVITSTTSSSSQLTSSATSSSSTSTTSTTSSSTSVSIPSLLTIDDFSWPAGNLNELNAISGVPYPNWLAYTVYQPLVTLNGSLMYSQGVLQVLPALAENWTVSPDGATYTFNLRPGVTFSNGDPLNSYQIWAEMYGFYYLADNSSDWYISYGIFNMTNVEFGSSTLALMNSSGLINPNAQLLSIMSNSSWPIYVIGPNQIVFHIIAPESWFPEALVVYTGLIFDTQYVLDNGGFGTPVTPNTYFNTNPIPGTGPYEVTNVVDDASVQFTKYTGYWAENWTAAQIQANPYMNPGEAKNVLVQAKIDDVSRYVDLSSGAAQIAGIQTQDWPLVLANPNEYSYFVLPNASQVFVGVAMNTQRYPTNITAVRQAIEHAINYTDVAAKAYFGE